MVRVGALTGVQAETATLTALTGAVVLFGFSVWAGLLSARLPMAGSSLLALAVTACGLLFGAAGALTSQLFSPRRRATQMAMLALGVLFAVRIVADGTRGLGWLRWSTPFGWAEETHAFTGDVWWPVTLVLVTAAAVVAPALLLQRRRDMGAGALFADRRARSRLALLGSPARFALRSEISTVLVWAASLGAYAVVVGLLAKDVSSFVSTSRGFQDVAARLATATLSRPEGFLALIFTFFAPPVALMGVFQVGAARSEESAGRAEIVLATAVPRWRWLLGRVVVGIGGVVFTALCAGMLAWTGTALKGGGVGLAGMERAAVNMLPAALLFLALAVAAFGLLPRLTVAVGAGAVALTYVLELVGALLRAPSWLLDLSPFHHLAAVPIAPVNTQAALVMSTVAACLVAVGIVAFDRRDVAGL
jgi:ABC-2 type transport system permease protein